MADGCVRAAGWKQVLNLDSIVEQVLVVLLKLLLVTLQRRSDIILGYNLVDRIMWRQWVCARGLSLRLTILGERLGTLHIPPVHPEVKGYLYPRLREGFDGWCRKELATILHKNNCFWVIRRQNEHIMG